MRISLLLAGGIGTRLWPKSTKEAPKQFNRLLSDKILLHDTIDRLDDDIEKIIISNIYYEQLLDDDYFSIYEPVGRNTAPAICISVLYIIDKYQDIDPKDIYISVLPSDHYFDDNFSKFINEAFDMLNEDVILTFGIRPEYPETGYGYINYKGDSILKFIEKPDYDNAQVYVRSGDYLWNSGVFLFNAKTIIDEFKKHAPYMYNRCVDILTKSLYMDRSLIISSDYEECEDISFDYAIMEKTNKGKVLKYEHIWNDIGQWDRLYRINDKDNNGNYVKKCHILDCNNCYIEADYGNVFVVGMDDTIIVKNNSNLLISSMKDADKIKTLLPKLDDDISKRPWGYYQTLYKDEALGYHSKRIVVYPNKRLSLQYHNYRAEHWTICSGEGIAEIGEDIHNVLRDSRLYVPIGIKHRICNTGKVNLVFIETQIGDYIGEDDYGRA